MWVHAIVYSYIHSDSPHSGSTRLLNASHSDKSIKPRSEGKKEKDITSWVRVEEWAEGQRTKEAGREGKEEREGHQGQKRRTKAEKREGGKREEGGHFNLPSFGTVCLVARMSHYSKPYNSPQHIS